jgi:2-dehydro-3-deoxygluconokinase
LTHATKTASDIFSRFPDCKWVANTFRFDGNVEAGIEYYATLNTKNEQSVSPLFTTKTVVDKVGSGDCFMAGLIYGISSKHTLEHTIGFAAAAAFGKLQEHGDATRNSVKQILHILRQFKPISDYPI